MANVIILFYFFGVPFGSEFKKQRTVTSLVTLEMLSHREGQQAQSYLVISEIFKRSYIRVDTIILFKL